MTKECLSTITLSISANVGVQEIGSPVLGKQSAGDSKLDLVLGDEDCVVSRVVVVLMPGFGRYIGLSHADIGDLRSVV